MNGPVSTLQAVWGCSDSSYMHLKRPEAMIGPVQCAFLRNTHMGPMPAGKAACAFELAAMWGDTDRAKDEEWMEVGQHLCCENIKGKIS